jgi:hypothetical protein
MHLCLNAHYIEFRKEVEGEILNQWPRPRKTIARKALRGLGTGSRLGKVVQRKSLSLELLKMGISL